MRDYEEFAQDLRDCASGRFSVCMECGASQFGVCVDTVKARMCEAADAIEELQTQINGWIEQERKSLLKSVPRWIPVTEQLPETGEIVLVYGKRGGIYTAEHNRNARWPGTFWKLNSKSHHCEPTHWMPLPEPPKEG